MARGHALIIEDSSTARIILSRLLERADISSKAVTSAEEAFPALQSEHFDVIFLDHLLPGMDGFQALEKLKSQPETQSIPVFMYTSQNAEKYLQEARALGAAGVIRKQVDRDQLLRTLDLILSDIPEPEQSDTLRLAVENVGQPLSEGQEQTNRRITGRVSTLEVAYEELEEEVRELKQHLDQVQLACSSRMDRQSRRLMGLGIVSVLLIAALGWMVIWQSNLLENHVQQTSDRFSLMQSVMGGIIELINR